MIDKEVERNLMAIDKLMNKIETSINPTEKIKLEDAFRVMDLDSNNNKFTLGDESRFVMDPKLVMEIQRNKKF